MSYYLGLDQGTSSTKAVLFKNNRLITKYSIGLSTKYTNQRWVEQDPIEIINNTISCIKKVLVKVKKNTFLSNKNEFLYKIMLFLILWDS